MINIKRQSKKIFALIIVFSLILVSCSKVSKDDISSIKKAVDKSNEEKLYKTSFVLEVKDIEQNELIMFVQGNYSIDKSEKQQKGVIMNGELVQTVYNTPSSLKFGFYDNTYVTISDEYKILSDMEEDLLLKQFMCAPAYAFTEEETESIKKSDVSNGTMYSANIKKGSYDYLKNLLGDDIYSFSSMKQPKKELTEFSDINCKYVISKDGILTNREISYTVIAYDVVPYFPGHQASNDDYKRKFSVSLKYNYKEFGDNVSVDISDFLPDESQAESQAE